jgi:hypothetical protein
MNRFQGTHIQNNFFVKKKTYPNVYLFIHNTYLHKKDNCANAYDLGHGSTSNKKRFGSGSGTLLLITSL